MLIISRSFNPDPTTAFVTPDGIELSSEATFHVVITSMFFRFASGNGEPFHRPLGGGVPVLVTVREKVKTGFCQRKAKGSSVSFANLCFQQKKTFTAI